jgi:hypothetical protein
MRKIIIAAAAGMLAMPLPGLLVTAPAQAFGRCRREWRVRRLYLGDSGRFI